MGYNSSQILFNDGKGNFSDSGQKLTQQGHGVGSDDLNGDGHPDIFITCAGYKSGNEENYNNKPSRIYFNNGKGQFHDSGQNLGDKDLSGNAVHLVDIDSDGDIDVVVEYNQNPDILYFNNGKGYFTKSDTIIPENPLFFDIDADGEICSYDASLILQYVVDFDPIPEDPRPWMEWRLMRADVDIDGEILACDADYILQYIVEIIPELPITEQ